MLKGFNAISAEFLAIEGSHMGPNDDIDEVLPTFHNVIEV